MDTSKEYVRMCDCPEIQEQWVVQEGDWATVIDPELDEGVPVMLDWTNFDPRTTLSSESVDDAKEYFKERGTWLPRQDQLQEMLDGDWFMVLERFAWHMENRLEEGAYWYSNGANTQLGSTEQSWLVFVMHEKHNKVWNGEGWI